MPLGFGAIAESAIADVPGDVPFTRSITQQISVRVRVTSGVALVAAPLTLLVGPFPLNNSAQWKQPQLQVRSAAPDQLHTNIGRFTNPIPFVSTDRPMVWRVPLVPPPQSLPLNLNLFKNAVPFAQADASKLWPVYDFTSPVAYPNLALQTAVVAAVPFFKTDWSNTWPVYDFIAPQFYPNLALSNPIPFASTDRRRILFVPLVPSLQAQLYNINVYTNPIPFNQADRSKPAAIGQATPQSQPYNTALLTVTLSPFFQTDWPVNGRARWNAPEPYQRNIHLADVTPTIEEQGGKWQGYNQHDWKPWPFAKKRKIEELDELIEQLHEIAERSSRPVSSPVILYSRPLAEALFALDRPITDFKVSRAKIAAEQLLKRQLEDDEDSAILLLLQ